MQLRRGLILLVFALVQAGSPRGGAPCVIENDRTILLAFESTAPHTIVYLRPCTYIFR